MDVYSAVFTYPRPRPLHPSSSTFDNSTELQLQSPPDSSDQQSKAEAITHANNVAMMARSTQGCQVAWSPTNLPMCWSWQLVGMYQQVMAARGIILSEIPLQTRFPIKVACSEILESPSSSPTLKSEFRVRLDDIASRTLTHIAVVNNPAHLSNGTPPDGITPHFGWSGLETEPVCEVLVTGSSDAVDRAKVLLLVMLDEMNGLHSESCEIEHTQHYIIAGRQRDKLRAIQEETATNIYLPSPLQGLIGPTVDTQITPLIWITGEFFGVQRARDMLSQAAAAVTTQSRDTAILPRKLHWMVTERQDDLRAIMSDNATFIRFPAPSSSTSLITVFGENHVNIRRTIRSIMQLACQFYVASCWLLPKQNNTILNPPTSISLNQVLPYMQTISVTTGAEIVFKPMCFELHGLESEVRTAASMLMELDVVKPFFQEFRFQIELANEHRDFLSGKKNGKINKIMQSSHVKIKFEMFNDHNFLIDLSGSDTTVLQGLALLKEELPAEISFHVPESYHKRIIGVGGKSIQRIMKRFGVYVKFSNAEEFASLGGYNNNEDNVIARTPTKNAVGLEHLKGAIMDVINPRDKDYVNETVVIPRRYHRILMGEKSIFIRDIESKTNSQVRFPSRESASDIVTIFGPESQVQIASASLLDHVPFEADLVIPPSREAPLVCSSPEFASVVDRIKRELEVLVAPIFRNQTAADLPPHCSFKFRCQKSNSEFLITAQEMVEQFLRNNHVPLHSSSTVQTHKRGDSFAEAFPHFDSKVLPATARRTHESTDLGRPSEIIIDRRLRMASSSPDVKAMFNHPQHMYNLGNDKQGDEQGSSWSMQPIMTGVSHTPAEERDDSLKRGSDSLLEAKIRGQIPQSRSTQTKTQSLDLTFSLSKIAEMSRPQPDSPSYSPNGDGEGSSPNSATAPSFPSVYHPSTSTKKAVIGPPGARASITIREGLPDEDGDQVAGVMSHLGL